ncbi:MAG: phosphotransferase, partial [Nanoarchaeota archaeon]|nr:phosphotransferase [Nanoarchaeota archaeon]
IVIDSVAGTFLVESGLEENTLAVLAVSFGTGIALATGAARITRAIAKSQASSIDDYARAIAKGANLESQADSIRGALSGFDNIGDPAAVFDRLKSMGIAVDPLLLRQSLSDFKFETAIKGMDDFDLAYVGLRREGGEILDESGRTISSVDELQAHVINLQETAQTRTLFESAGTVVSDKNPNLGLTREWDRVPSPASEPLSPLSISDGSLRRVLNTDEIDEIARRSTEIREGVSTEAPMLKRTELDTTAREAYIQSIERHYEAELGLPEGSISIQAPETLPKSGNEVFIANYKGEAGEQKALLIKVFLKDQPGALPGAEAFREVEALSILKKNQINVPEVIDIASVEYPVQSELRKLTDQIAGLEARSEIVPGDLPLRKAILEEAGSKSQVMVATEIAPGKSVASKMKDIGKLSGAERGVAITNLEAQLGSVGEELARFQNSVPSTEFASPLSADVTKAKRHLGERFSAGQIDQPTYERLLGSIDDKVQEIEALGGTSARLVHGDFHGGNVFVDGSTSTVTFIDVESTLESLGKGSATVNFNPGNDYGRFMDSIVQQGTINGFDAVEIKRLENAFLSSYAANSGIPREELIKSIDFYRAKTSLVAMKYAETNQEVVAAIERLKGALLNNEVSEILTPAQINPNLVPSLQSQLAVATP